MHDSEKIGLIAGSGKLPFILASSIKNSGEYVVGLGIKGESASSLKKYVDTFHFFDVTDLEQLKRIIKEEKIKKIIMAGKVHKDILFKAARSDDTASGILSNLNNKGDYHILKAFSHDLEKEGIHFIEPSFFLGHLIPIAGVLTDRCPLAHEREDIDFGFSIAKKIAELDIGQTVVIKDRIVLAVEGVEGTDETIRRGGKIGRLGVVVKVSKPHQDLRFDMPVIGEDTVKTAKNVGITCIAVEAHKIIIIDKEEVIKKADKYNISIVAV